MDRPSDDERDLFLSSEKEPSRVPAHARPRPYLLWTSISLNILLLATLLFSIPIVQQQLASAATCLPRPYSPAVDALSEITWRFNNEWESSRYVGPPSDERDRAWRELYEVAPIRVSAAELERLNETSLPLDSGGFAIGLGVFHELHCLERMQQYFDVEHYFPDASAEERLDLVEHNYHCIELLRQSSMCRADITPITFYKSEEPGRKFGRTELRSSGLHRCMDHERIREWAREHSAPEK